VTAASHLPRIFCLAVSAAAHVAAFGALEPRRTPLAAMDDAADVVIDTLPAEPPLESVPPPTLAVAPPTPMPSLARSPARPAPALPAREREPPAAGASPRTSEGPSADSETGGREAADSETVHAPPVFAMTVRTGGSAASLPSGDPVGADVRPGSAAAPFAESEVSSPARPLGSVNAAYPASARAQQIEGDVVMEIVVDATGAVTDARVVQLVGVGADNETVTRELDDSALRAVHAARFTPALRAGRPVAERMRYTFTFALR
jgi:TonB family protein